MAAVAAIFVLNDNARQLAEWRKKEVRLATQAKQQMQMCLPHKKVTGNILIKELFKK